MLKVNQEKSKRNLSMVYELVKPTFTESDFTHLYGYQEKNYIVFKVMTHYAIGFNASQIVAIPMNEDGLEVDKPQTFTFGSGTRVSMSGLVTLSNGQCKLKLQVPGMIPKLMGSRQLEVDQVQEHGRFIQRLKADK